MNDVSTGMSYYFVIGATTKYGPINFAVELTPTERIKHAVNAEGKRRGLVLCHDWKAEPIDAAEFRRLTS